MPPPEQITAVQTLPPQDWMKGAALRDLMDALNAGSPAPAALMVGGCVRAALLGRPVEDIDIATVHEPPEVTRRVEAAGFKAVPTGIEHGTITAVKDKETFEITTLRKDVATDGRRATVAFTKDWRQDAMRRDFTMNTLLADMEGRIYDPLGQGIGDLRAGRVVFVGQPEERIAEDHLRILRFFRFHALCGRGEPDKAALSSCEAAADKIARLSKERITQEIFKILSAENPAQVLSLMAAHGIMPRLCAPSYSAETMAHLCTFQNRYGLAFLASRLLALADFKGENLPALDEWLLIPKVFKRDMEAVLRTLSLPDMSEDHAVKVAVYKCGRVAAAQSLMIELAQDRVMNGYAPAALKIIQTWDVPDFPVSGQDLIDQGAKPGPELGARLREMEEAWIAAGFRVCF